MSPAPSVDAMKNLKVRLASAAQAVYDAWEQDEEGHDEEYGGGGICHDIADAMAEALGHAGIEAASVTQSVGEVHVFVVAKFAEGVYSVDIPPYLYEKGSAYTWTKVPGVKFRPEDIDLYLVDRNPEKFEDYTESAEMGFRDWLEGGCGPLMVRRTWPEPISSDMEPQARRPSRRSPRSRRR